MDRHASPAAYIASMMMDWSRRLARRVEGHSALLRWEGISLCGRPVSLLTRLMKVCGVGSASCEARCEAGPSELPLLHCTRQFGLGEVGVEGLR